jgi:hypothetical protein
VAAVAAVEIMPQDRVFTLAALVVLELLFLNILTLIQQPLVAE